MYTTNRLAGIKLHTSEEELNNRYFYFVEREKMKTLFDLREKADSEIYEAVQNLFDEPLKIIKLGDQSINACIGC